ncbi:hypothetical protein BDZ91DRAFT_165144 [Kalaharituber pfeilii]|nr:hypothetical protein BDZ91DRAFT_165144 [Kalaharituber pfeilii]
MFNTFQVSNRSSSGGDSAKFSGSWVYLEYRHVGFRSANDFERQFRFIVPDGSVVFGGKVESVDVFRVVMRFGARMHVVDVKRRFRIDVGNGVFVEPSMVDVAEPRQPVKMFEDRVRPLVEACGERFGDAEVFSRARVGKREGKAKGGLKRKADDREGTDVEPSVMDTSEPRQPGQMFEDRARPLVEARGERSEDAEALSRGRDVVSCRSGSSKRSCRSLALLEKELQLKKKQRELKELEVEEALLMLQFERAKAEMEEADSLNGEVGSEE